MYKTILSLLEALLSDPIPPVSAMANTAALLWDNLKDLNWAGFYLARGNTLFLGPFQGKPACQIIAFGRGVCGTAALTRRIQCVKDVHAFPGHIACDAASRSEIVLPLIQNDLLLGVMDLDSPRIGRFQTDDVEGLQSVCNMLLSGTEWSRGLLG